MKLLSNIFGLVLVVGMLCQSSFAQEINIATGGTVNTCAGTFVDPGGSLGNYGNNDLNEITICTPLPPPLQLIVTFTSWDVEAGADYLYIYDGPSSASPAVIGSPFSAIPPGIISGTSGCLTFVWDSDAANPFAGWEGTISCGFAPLICVNCDSAALIATLPLITAQTTCENCDDYSSTDACGSAYMNGDDYTYQYTPTANEVIDVVLNNTSSYTGVFIFDGCPDVAGTNCVASNTSIGGDPELSNVSLTAGTTYFITISTNPAGGPQCTDFDITITIPSCTDGILNQDETGIDCGGTICGPCPNCYDGIQNGTETGIDCGAVCGIPCPCGITITPSPSDTVPCGGGSVTLVAVGSGSSTALVNSSFDGGTAGPGWSVSSAGQFDNPCGASIDGGSYMWMGATAPAPRTLETNPVDVSCGGEICFYLKFATQGGGSPCEGPDQPNEGVYLEYSTDGGATWTTINYFNPSGGYDPTLTGWNQYCFLIPAAAQTSSTLFHWFQDVTSANIYDHWGVDNVVVTTYACSSYYYDWDHVAGTPDDSTQVITTSGTATYGVWYTDGISDSCYQTITIFVDTLDPLVVNVTSGGCGSTGSITVDPAQGGLAPYTYAISGPVSQSNSTGSFTGLPGGTYTITVTGSGGCSITSTATITTSGGITVTASGTDENCTGSCDGTLSTTTTGGTGTLTYSWDGGPTPAAQNQTGVCSGTYEVTVTDASGCTGTDQITISAGLVVTAVIDPITNQCLTGNAFNFNGSNSTISAGSITTYSWDFGDGSTATGSSPSYSYGSSGTYTVTLTVGDGTCSAQVTQNVTVFDMPTVSASSTEELCFGDCDGSVTAVPAGTSGYTSEWFIFAGASIGTGNTISGLCPGMYQVVVTDVNGCTANNTAIVLGPSVALSASATGTDVNCFGVCDGTLDGSASGGTAGYTYSWDGGPSSGTEDQTSVCDGTYILTVTDANGCVETASYSVTEPAQLTASSTSTDMTCSGVCDGTLTATIGGGTLGYTYSWDGGPSAGTEDQTGVCAGTYTLTVTDANNCQATTTETVSEPPLLTVIADGTNLSCNGVCNGTVSSIVNGGTGVITYSWDNGAGSLASASGLCSNTYVVTVTDANGCTATDSYEVTEPPVLSISVVGVDNTCNGIPCDGSATTTVVGGSGSYSYQWDDPGLSTSANLTGLCASTYNVTVTDGNGCTAAGSVVIDEPDAIVVTTGAIDANCGASDGEVSAGASGGAGGFTYSWQDAASVVIGAGSALTGLPAGSYTVTVTDVAGCTGTAVAIINTTTGGTASAVVDNQVTCFGDCDGQATASIVGGTAPFTYLWSDGQPTATATGLCPGSYSVDVTDFNGCVSSASIVITEPLALNVAIILQTDPLCALSCNGSATATETGGTAPTTYAWTTGGTALIETGMCSGTHTITVTDANGCVASVDVTLTDPPVLTAAISMTPADCNWGCDGALDLTTAGGTPVLTYLWDNAATSEDISGLCAGAFNVTVTDANGCTANANATVTEPSAIILIPSGNDEICSQSNGDVSVGASGGTIAADYSYLWTDGSGALVGTTLSVTGLSAGTYTVVVTDDNGCTESVDVTINNQPAGTVAVTLDSNASCSGVCDGGATATITGGTIPFNYLWDNGETTQSATGLCVGVHTVDITDGNGCLVVGNIAITEPSALTLAITGTDPSCNGGMDGSADAIITGGTGPFTTTWTHGPTSEDLTGVLGSGTYTLDVTDANGCTVSGSVTITDPAPITSSILGTDVSCNGAADGTATATASGGTGTLTYSWSPTPGGGQGTDAATGLGPVAYTVTITDDNGCFVTEVYTPAEPTALLLTPSSTQSNCGQLDGEVLVGVIGGTGSYTYLWEDATSTVVGTTSSVTGLAAGTYTVTVTDGNGCTETTTATITDATGSTLSYTTVDVSCNGGNNGLIDLTVNGGTAPFTYAWTGPGGFADNTEDLSNLVAGTYDVIVTDFVGCVATETIVIAEPAALVVFPLGVDVSCYGSTDGEVSAGTIGGIPAYSYEWYDNAALTNNVGSGSPVTGLAAGTYYVEVTDGNGCTTNAQVDVDEPADMVVTTSAIDASCGQSDGTVSVVSTTGGSGVYVSEVWTDALGLPVADPNLVSSGTYTVTVTDDNGCIGTGIANVGDLTGPTTSLLGSVPVSCNGACDGSASVTVSGGSSPYTYLWSPVPGAGQGTATITDLCAGSYTVTVTDASGCQDNFTLDITEPTPVDVTITASADVSGFGLSDGSATAAGSGGTPIYTYEWFTGCPPVSSTGQTGTNASGLAAGDYSVIITDSKGCMDTTCVTINEPGAITSTVGTVDLTCYQSCDGSATVSASGGTPGYSYDWFDATTGLSTGQTGLTASGLCAGDYYVAVTDQNGILHTSITVTITEPTQITGTTSVISSYNGQDISCTGACDGSAQVVPSGGTAPYTYQWNDPGAQTTDIATGLCAGSYDVEVTDFNGCVETFTVVLTEPLPLSNVMSFVDASCYGVCDGEVSATPSDGTGPYTYQWNDPGLSTTQSVTGLCVGSYDVIVTDANGCTVNGTTTVSEPTQIVLSSDSTESNCGLADGSVTVLIVSGDGPLTQLWDAAAGSATTATVTGLSSGCYVVTVTDVHGCTQDRTICVTDAGAPQVEVLTLTDALCKDSCDGFAQIQVTPGTNSVPPLSFAWYDSGMLPIGQTTASATGLCAGDYIAEMTDANGCVATVSLTIGEPIQLSATISSSTDVTCFGDCDGEATVVAGGGTTGYTYSWNDPSNQTTSTSTGLCPTSYTVTVTDANGCTTIVPATIGEPLQILATALGVDAFCATASGSATATVTQGGVGALSYLWTPSGQTTNPATGLTPGSYDVLITDSDGCTGTATALVGDIPASVATAQVINDVSCNGLCDGEATVSLGGTGTAPYSYEWFNATTGATTGQLTQNATGLCAGSYYCVATDANTCVSISDTIVIVEPGPMTLTTTPTDITCEAICNGTADVSITGGAAPFTYQWDDPLLQTTQVAGSLCPGIYNVTVTDASGCTATSDATVGEPPAIALDSTVIDANCGLADGSGCVTASGGVGGFTYSWPTGGTGSCESGLAASSYLVTVTDSNLCVAQIVVEVSDLGGPVASIVSQVEVSCNGLTDGSATVDMTGGGGSSFTVQWDANAGSQTTPTASNLGAGVYTVTITDDLGCSASASATITEPTAIATNPGFVDPSCFGYCDGSMGVVVSGGTPVYGYQWFDAANVLVGSQDTLTGSCSGAYTLVITDANGCTEILNYTLTDPSQVSGSSSDTPVLCNGACDGTGIATGVVGVGTFAYQWDAAAGSQTTATATGLCPGTYDCLITDGDGCFTNVSATITEPPALTTGITNFGHLTCNGSCDGYAEVLATGGTAPYSYDWGGFGTTQQLTGLCAGTYTATVTDANGCVSSSTVVIDEPSALGISFTSMDNLCYQSCDGTASVSVSGGTLPYSYQWDDPGFSTTLSVTGLCVGTYTCTVTDSNGCVIDQVVTIAEPTILDVVVLSTTDANCGQANGEICIGSVGGVGPFTYQWNDPGATTTACLTGILSGCYQITVLDANGCSTDSTICINNIAGPVITLGAITDVSCFGANDGEMSFTVSGGTGTLTYGFYDALNNLLSTTPGPYTGLAGGNYYLQVTDGAGCIVQESGFVSESSVLNSAITSSTDVTCNGLCDGEATVSISGGTLPYTLIWSNGQITNTATGLCVGTWTVDIIDATGCQSSADVTIIDPLGMAINDSVSDVSCGGGNDGSIDLTVTGGTPAYTYLWSPAVSTGSTASSLIAGSYTIDVTDANGCLATTTLAVAEPTAMVVTYGAVNSTCSLCNGSASLTVAGGATPYSYQWLNGGSNPFAATNLQLCPGNHPVIVTDANGCSVSLTVVITDEPSPQIDAMLFTSPDCSGGNNGTAEVMATGGTGVLSYLWDAAAGSQTSSLASGLSAGTYCVTVSDVNNCVVSNCVTITDPAPLNAVPDGSTTICYGDSAQIWASGQGGTPGYTINWSTSGLSGTGPIMVSPLVLTDYCFTVEDANGCVSAAACVTIDVLPPISVDIMPSASICSGDSVTVTASASGGNGGPYTFSWASGAGTGFTPTSSGSPSTIIDNPTTDTWYYVTVSDGCSLDAIDSTLIVLDPTPVAFLNAIDSNGCAPFSASFILNTDIGVNFDYDFDCDGIVDYSGTNTNPTHTYVNAGIYDVCVTVSSAAGCQTQLTASGIVEVYPVPIASFSADPWTATEIDPYIQFYDESFGGSVYSWIFEVGDTVNGVQGSVITSGNTTGTIENPEHFYGSVGTYEVTLVVTNQYGCTDVYVHQVEIELERTIFVPNSFTPNDDGKNDFFIPQGMGLDNENFEMYIFNRWGELIYETHSLNRPWDGRSKNGKKVSKTEVYVWLVKTLDSNGNAIELKGHVTLLK